MITTCYFSGAKPKIQDENHKKKNQFKKVATGVLIGSGISAGVMGIDLFATNGKLVHSLSRGKVTFLKTMSEELDNVVRQDHFATPNRLEAFLGVPGLHAVWVHRGAHQLYNWKVPVLPRVIYNISRMITGIEIHPGAKVGKNVFFDHTGAIVGQTAVIDDNVTLIGRVCLGSNGKNGFLRHTVVENGATLGMNSTMLGRITLGKNSTIGAGAIITKDVPQGFTVIGNPAYIISINGKKLPNPTKLSDYSKNKG